jgi:ribonuclease HI
MRLSTFHVLRGIAIRPTATSLIQTDGSYGAKYFPLSRTAVLLTNTKGQEYSFCNTYDNHSDSTESEWCSVLDGIKYAARKEEMSIEIENDNMGVVRCLVTETKPRRPHIAEYYTAIYDYSGLFEYLSIRWIPRRLNRAHGIFTLR